jgi:hypothetical protein
VARQKDEIKAVLNLVDAIFYGDTGHRLGTPSGGTCCELPARYPLALGISSIFVLV